MPSVHLFRARSHNPVLLRDSMLTPQQQTVLTEIENRRLTVVRAGPGSGKTRVFVEALQRQLDGWTSARVGVAALSFTNVAHEVVTSRLGGSPPAPHFVGTIDAFLLRFVVQPFARLLGFCPQGARLLPEGLARTIAFPEVKYGNQQFQKASLFRYAFCAGTEDKPEAFVRSGYGKPVEVLPALSAKVLTFKQREWAKNGRITHADSQYLSSLLLKGPVAEHIASLVTARFPVILVDEFQDTGWFLGRAMLELLSRVKKGLVVGDPDQAIFQFAGSDRGLFDKVDACAGISSLMLDESHRCSKRVGAVASALSRSGKLVRAVENAKDGNAVLLIHEDAMPEPQKVIERLRSILMVDDADLAVLSRRGLRGDDMASDHPWGGGVTGRICDAVAQLRSGSSRNARVLLSRELSGLLLDAETPTDDDFATKGVDPAIWRREIAQALFLIEQTVDGETWNEWIARTKIVLKTLADRFGLASNSLATTLKKNNKDGGAKRQHAAPPAVAPTDPHPVANALTIHAAKGQEFDAVIVLVGKPHKSHAPCPSTSWWDDDLGSEEREVAYVACSRAKATLCLAIHRTTYETLLKERSAFVVLFEVLDDRAKVGDSEA